MTSHRESRAGQAVLVIALVVAALAVTALVLSFGPAEAQAPRSPFAVGAERSGDAPASGLAAWILAQQAGFYRDMAAAVRVARVETAGLWSLILLGFGYGVFHAAGPGHGKAIIASYVVANERALTRAIGIAFAAAALQGVVAFGIVALVAIALGGNRSALDNAVIGVEAAGFAAIAVLGALLLWRKGRALLGLLSPGPMSAGAAAACDHVHLPGAEEVLRWRWRDAIAAVLGAGLRPCSGALLILVFTLSQGVLWIGAAAVAAMSFGTALTTSGIAGLAVFAKSLALRLAGGRSRRGEIVARSLEVAAAFAVLLLGIALFTGYLANRGGA